MKIKKIKRAGAILLAVAITIAILFLIGAKTAAHAEAPVIEEKPTKLAQLTHQQQVWLSALEWCESRGNPQAINKVDRDGTPSYGSFQFKPSTMVAYGIKYGLWNKDTFTDEFFRANILMDSELQREIVAGMLNDKSTVWTQQFPDCVKNKIGRPPIK